MNRIVLENQLPGSPRAEWDIIAPEAFHATVGLRAGDESIQGFTTDISVNVGQTVFFKIKTSPPARSYRLDIYRMGYYGGCGARKVATVVPHVPLPQLQPDDLFDEATGATDCGNWQVSAVWDVPAEAVSGIYFARLARTDGVPGANHVVFVVRDDRARSELLFQTSDTTWQAYNLYGGASLYRRPGHPARRAYRASYNRPFRTRVDEVGGIDFIKDWVFNAEYPMVRWLERNGYDVSYFTCVDSDRFGEKIRDHRVFLSVGHDEYWSARQRANVEAARDAGVHMAFFSGNEVFWKIRWEPGADNTGDQHRTLVCYKESRDGKKLDPRQDVWTGTWRDPRFSPPADGGRPENGLTGTLFMVNNNYQVYPLRVSAEEGRLRFWRHTDLAELPPGASATLAPGLIGWEWDCDVDNGCRPAGLMRLSSTTISGVPVLQDYGSAGAWADGPATHHLTLYRHASGALVFGAGTINWAWGLDAEHDLQRLDERGQPVYPADTRIQQATVNLLADMGVQPATLQADLVRATAARPSQPPRATIDPLRAPLTAGAWASFGGAARAEGAVGAVEVSLDDGATWHPAEGRERWSFSGRIGRPGPLAVLARAVDDCGVIGPLAARVVLVAPAQHSVGAAEPAPAP